jgi:hypothetical protein
MVALCWLVLAAVVLLEVVDVDWSTTTGAVAVVLTVAVSVATVLDERVE